MKKLLPLLALCFFLLHVQAQNYSLNFNGVNQYVSIPHQASIDLSANFTIEGWVYPQGSGSQIVQGGMIINKESSYEIARFTDGTLEYALSANGNGTDWTWINSGLVLPLFTWSHFAFIKSGTSVTIYINGAASYTSSSNPATLVANSQVLLIANRGTGSHFFNGNTDEIRVWNTALTLAQIKANMFNRNLSNSASGLVGYYRMNENTGATTANSSTNATGIDGTLIGSPLWQASPVQYKPNALSFDGVDDFVTVPYNASLDITTAITLEAWVYPTKATGIQDVMSKSSLTTNTGYIFPRTDDGWANTDIYLYIGGGWRSIATAFPSLNAWHHLAATYDGATMKIYVDGVLKNSLAQTGAIATNSNVLTIGNQAGFPENFGGYADELRIWNVARTQAQIQANMNAELDPTTQTGLVSYYTLNQGVTTGTNAGLSTVIDQKGSNNGTLSNFAMTGAVSNFISQYTSLSALPVSWLSFTAQEQNNAVLLNWSTASENSSGSFLVQHSTDAGSWSNIGTISAAGNSSTARSYSFTDYNPANGTNYYRIRQEDIDGKFTYSKTVSCIYQSQLAQMTVYPNPVVNGVLKLQLQQPAIVSVYTNSGVLILRKQLSAGTQQINISGVAKGSYVVKAAGAMVQVVVQ